MKAAPSAKLSYKNHHSLLSLWELSNVLIAMKPQLFTKIIKMWEKKVNCIRVHVYHNYWFEHATLLKMDSALLSFSVFKNLLSLFYL